MSKSTLASFKISNPHRTIQSIYDHNSCIVLACFLQNMLIFSEIATFVCFKKSLQDTVLFNQPFIIFLPPLEGFLPFLQSKMLKNEPRKINTKSQSIFA